MLIVYNFTSSYLLAYIAMFLTGASEVMRVISNHLLSENLAALMIILISLSLYKIYKTGKIGYFVLLGLSMAVLVLTKAIFMYLIYVLVIILLILIFKKHRGIWKKFLAGAGLFMIIYFAIVGGWMYRNYQHFNEFTITNKSGIVLYYRSALNTMTKKEFFASFIYWLPGKDAKEAILDRIFEEEDYIKLDRRNDEGYRMSSRKILEDLQDSFIEQGYDKQESVLLADKKLRQMAIQRILKNPARHVLVTIPIAWKGIFIETGYSFVLRNPNWFWLSARSVVFVNIILFFSFFYVIISSLVRRKWDIALFFLSPFYLYFLNTVATHNKERYNFPLIPVMVIAAVLLADLFIRKYKNKKNKDRKIEN
jgi:4-amino-4-deoxy-L-arabinose transferase-like glycosyltransferase